MIDDDFQPLSYKDKLLNESSILFLLLFFSLGGFVSFEVERLMKSFYVV